MKKLLSMYNFLRFSIIVDGETQYVPSDQMLREVLPTLPNMAEQEELCLDSNDFVLSLLFKPTNEVVKKELEISTMRDTEVIRLGCLSLQNFAKGGRR